METSRVRFSANLRQAAGVLRLDYFVENRGKDVAFVRVRGGLRMKPLRRPYSLLQSDPRRLFLSYQEFPIPPFVEVYVPLIPPACRLEMGERHEDFAELEVEVEEWHPYAEIEYPSNAERVLVQDIEFATEYLWGADVSSVSEYKAEPGLHIVIGNESHSLKAALRAQTPFTVLRRTDDFFRY
jgi:hypothetical protein